MKQNLTLSIKFLSILFIIPLNIFAQCFTAPYGQKPSTTQTITNCNGNYQTFASNCLNGEYSKVNVVNGNIYSFRSSKSSDFITISDNNGTVSHATGTGTVTWTATLTTVVRFYTHANSTCASDNKRKKRMAACTMPATCSSPGSINTSSITNTSATISWGAASPAPANGYNYEIRTSGTGGSGSSGLTASGSTTASVTSANITGLTPGTVYTPYVRSNCSSSFSNYVAGNAFTTTSTTTNPVPVFSHIVVVIGENTSAGSVFGSSSAPYINALANAGAKFTNSFALTHPSQPNYLQLYSGSNQGVTDDSYITTKFTTANLGRELINAGKTYTTYSEGLPSVGYDGSSSGLYVRKHNPAANWMGTGTNQIPTTTNQPFTSFPADFNNLPAVSFVVPNLCNDGHDVCAPLNNSVLQFDRWIQNNLDAYKQWCINNNSLLIVTYDEDDFSSTNKIATVFYGANVAQAIYSLTINHYNVLRTIEDGNGLTTHAGSAAAASTIDYCWTAPAMVSRAFSSLETKADISKDIFIFPNPAKDKINVVLRNMAVKNLRWEIIDITGVKLKTGNVANVSKGNMIEITVDNLKNGIYQLRFSDHLNILVNRFVIAR
jgi:phosphatidylinositol-3-phosphatase